MPVKGRKVLGLWRPILKGDIEDAQKRTRSAAAAARYLGVTYKTYKKYARMYGIHDKHINQKGYGISKGRRDPIYRIPLSEILTGQHPNYNIRNLRIRLVQEKVLTEHCYNCNFNERRITDDKIPLILVFKDNNNTNFKLENLAFLCYNCSFLMYEAKPYKPRANRLSLEKAALIGTNADQGMLMETSQDEVIPPGPAILDAPDLPEEDKLEILRELYPEDYK